MQVQVNLTDEQVDEILLRGLINGFHVNLEFKGETEFETLNNAFLTLIRYYTTESELEEFIKSIPNKQIRTESAKLLAEAYGGL